MKKTEFKLTDPYGRAPSKPPFNQSVSTGVPWHNLPVTREYTLGQLLGTFMDDQFKPDPIITRASAANGKSEDFNSLGYASVSLAEGKSDRHMDPFRITFAANGSEDLSSHEGEELIICTEGEIELTYGNEKQILKSGDTAYYNSVVKHGLRALGGKSASIFGVVFMPF